MIGTSAIVEKMLNNAIKKYRTNLAARGKICKRSSAR